jgi:hypothetical protein
MASAAREAARRLRASGVGITQVNAPGTTSAGTMGVLAKAGATHAEPGNALHGTTPLHLFYLWAIHRRRPDLLTAMRRVFGDQAPEEPAAIPGATAAGQVLAAGQV